MARVGNTMKIFLCAVAAVSNWAISVTNSPSMLPERVVAFFWCNMSTSFDVSNWLLFAVGLVVRKALVP